jgi:hypothetical protein
MVYYLPLKACLFGHEKYFYEKKRKFYQKINVYGVILSKEIVIWMAKYFWQERMTLHKIRYALPVMINKIMEHGKILLDIGDSL